MNAPDPEEQFGALLAAFDEGLAADCPPVATPLPPELRGRLERAQECLRRLDRDRRHGQRGFSRAVHRGSDIGACAFHLLER